MATQGSSTGDVEPIYRMTGGPKKLIIINNKKFDPKTKFQDRDGTSEDAKSLEDVFTKLGFDVVVHENKQSKEMQKLMKKVSEENHSECECFAVAVLSHGDAKHDTVFGVDGSISISSLVDPFKYCPTLVGKPKIFIFETFTMATDTGVTQSDAFGESGNPWIKTVPTTADFLYVYSEAPGFGSSGPAKRSLFIQSLTKALNNQENSSLDILRILTRVNNDIVKEWVSIPSSQSQDLQKQVPRISHTLTKDLYLIPKH